MNQVKKYHFLFLIGQLGPGGSEHQLFNLLENLDRSRYQVAVAVWNYSKEDVYLGQILELGIPVFSLGPPSSSFIQKLKAIRRLVKQLKPELVHSYSFFTNFPAYLSTLGLKIISIGSIRGDFITAQKDFGSRLCILCTRWPRVHICNSILAVNSIKRLGGPMVPGKALVVRNGIALDKFPYCPVTHSQRPCILGVGSLLPVKRWDRLLVAAKSLHKMGFDFTICLVGGGPLREILERKANALGLSKYVEFVGNVRRVNDYYAKGLFLVHVSESEGCPNVVMEAMASGRPVVAMDVGDIPSLIEHGSTGYVVPSGDINTLVERLAILLRDQNLCDRMGKEGRAKAEREFGVDRLLSETLSAYSAAGWKGL